MKSKTSCFSVTILKKNTSRYWPVWALFLCYLLYLFPFRIWLNIQNQMFYVGASETEKQITIITPALHRAVMPLPFFFFAAAAAMMVFSYLYTAKSANMIHALPVNRFELFLTNYISGILFLVIPEIIAFVAAVMVCLANRITCMEYLFWWLLCALGVTFFAYSLAVFVAMFTGLILAMPVYYITVNYLYAGCLYLVHSVKDILSYGLVQNTWNPGKNCVLSPLYYLINHLNTRIVYNDKGRAEGIQIYGTEIVAVYAAAGVVFVVLAYWLYKRRQIESAGDFISIPMMKPVFRWGVGFCGGMMLALFTTGQLKDSVKVASSFPCMLASTLIFVSICYWLAEMLLQKKCKVFRKKRFGDWAALAVLSVGFLLLFELDVFGIERRVPESGEVEAAFINMDYPLLVAEENIPEMIAMHQDIIRHKKEYQNNQAAKDGKSCYATFRYYLKDGSMLERRYALPMTEQYLSDADTPSAQIIAWEKQEDSLKREVFGFGYENNEYHYGTIELYSKEGDTMTYRFAEDEIPPLIQAVEQDLREGNFNAFYVYSDKQDQPYYLSNLYLEFYNHADLYCNMWEYFDNYRMYTEQKTELGQSWQRGIYITLGEECGHTIEALRKLNIVNDTWGLCTYEEWERILTEGK